MEPAEAPAAERPRYLELDGVRACSILLVMAGHMLPLGPSWMGANAATAHLGMSLFFCLSGFLIVNFLRDDQRIGVFLARRLARIVPAMWVYLAALLVIGLPLDAFALNAVFVSNYFVDGLLPKMTGHLWSLCVEMHFYLCVAALVWVAGARGLFLIPVACVAVTLIRIDVGAYHNINTHLRVDEILIGGCLALLAPRLAEDGGAMRWLKRNFFLVAIPVFLAWSVSAHDIGGPLNYLRPYLTGALVFMAAFVRWAPLSAVLTIRPMRYVARISYALYLWHLCTTLGWFDQGTTFERYGYKRPISFALAFAAAHVSTFWIEDRIRFWVRDRMNARAAAGRPSPG